MKSAYQVIDVFSGIGCASLGFKQAGFDIAAALEIDPLRCEVYEKNLKLRPLQNDVMKVSGKDLLRNAELKRGGRFCMIGCPPCQSFSKLSDTRGISALSDPRSKYVMKFAKLVEETLPVAVIFENVPWMLEGPGGKFFRSYRKRLKKSGYQTFVDIINAADFGVPQNRRRVVAISIRKKFVNTKVEEKLAKFYETKKRKYKTVWDAIKDLKPLRPGQTAKEDPMHFARKHNPKVLKMIKMVPKNGGSRTELPRRMWLRCHKAIRHGADSVYGRMSWDNPSPTITCRCTTPACGRFIHPSQSRGISLREAARLQTIPDRFQLASSRQKGEEMIGDAVPVLLAKRIAQNLLDVLPKSVS